MAASQQFITQSTPLGANLVANGATFRAWAPEAKAVFVSLKIENSWSESEDSLLLTKDAKGYWAGFVTGIKDGDEYKFYIIGKGSSGHKRDPYARELGPGYPNCACIVRDPQSYPWHDSSYRPPAFQELIIYQFHVGTFWGKTRSSGDGRFLDALDKIEYLVDLGVNAIEPLPIVEFSAPDSMGYDGSDIFSPESDYTVPYSELPSYLPRINSLLEKKGQAPLQQTDLGKDINQLKVLIDICHLYGLAIIFDVVYNHASDAIAGQAESLYYFDRQAGTERDNSLYFTNEDHCGPVYAFWKEEVRQFLIDNAKFFVEEYHIDGFRYDQTSVIVKQNTNDGWRFCQDLTSTLKSFDPAGIHIAEYWDVDPYAVKSLSEGGANFDASWHNGLRDAIWAALKEASQGAGNQISMDAIAAHLYPSGFPEHWKGVQYVESHDEVRVEKNKRVPRMADPSNARSWYARSRAKVATGLVLTAPGIPMIFMGQEILEDKQWSDNPSYFNNSLIYWEGLNTSKEMADHLRFTRELIWTRRNYRGLRGNKIKIIHIHNGNRIIAFQRWEDWAGHDVVVVASLNENNLYGYHLGFPRAGNWKEIFNSNTYENWVNPSGVGNGGGIYANDQPFHDLPASSNIVIPANSILILTHGG